MTSTTITGKPSLDALIGRVEALKTSGSLDLSTEEDLILDRAYRTYSLFWALRLKLIDASGFKQVAADEKPWTLQDIVNRLVNCCNE